MWSLVHHPKSEASLTMLNECQHLLEEILLASLDCRSDEDGWGYEEEEEEEYFSLGNPKKLNSRLDRLRMESMMLSPISEHSDTFSNEDLLSSPPPILPTISHFKHLEEDDSFDGNSDENQIHPATSHLKDDGLFYGSPTEDTVSRTNDQFAFPMHPVSTDEKEDLVLDAPSSFDEDVPIIPFEIDSITINPSQIESGQDQHNEKQIDKQLNKNSSKNQLESQKSLEKDIVKNTNEIYEDSLTNTSQMKLPAREFQDSTGDQEVNPGIEIELQESFEEDQFGKTTQVTDDVPKNQMESFFENVFDQQPLDQDDDEEDLTQHSDEESGKTKLQELQEVLEVQELQEVLDIQGSYENKKTFSEEYFHIPSEVIKTESPSEEVLGEEVPTQNKTVGEPDQGTLLERITLNNTPTQLLKSSETTGENNDGIHQDEPKEKKMVPVEDVINFVEVSSEEQSQNDIFGNLIHQESNDNEVTPISEYGEKDEVKINLTEEQSQNDVFENPIEKRKLRSGKNDLESPSVSEEDKNRLQTDELSVFKLEEKNDESLFTVGDIDGSLSKRPAAQLQQGSDHPPVDTGETELSFKSEVLDNETLVEEDSKIEAKYDDQKLSFFEEEIKTKDLPRDTPDQVESLIAGDVSEQCSMKSNPLVVKIREDSLLMDQFELVGGGGHPSSVNSLISESSGVYSADTDGYRMPASSNHLQFLNPDLDNDHQQLRFEDNDDVTLVNMEDEDVTEPQMESPNVDRRQFVEDWAVFHRTVQQAAPDDVGETLIVKNGEAQGPTNILGEAVTPYSLRSLPLFTLATSTIPVVPNILSTNADQAGEPLPELHNHQHDHVRNDLTGFSYSCDSLDNSTSAPPPSSREMYDPMSLMSELTAADNSNEETSYSMGLPRQTLPRSSTPLATHQSQKLGQQNLPKIYKPCPQQPVTSTTTPSSQSSIETCLVRPVDSSTSYSDYVCVKSSTTVEEESMVFHRHSGIKQPQFNDLTPESLKSPLVGKRDSPPLPFDQRSSPANSTINLHEEEIGLPEFETNIQRCLERLEEITELVNQPSSTNLNNNDNGLEIGSQVLRDSRIVSLSSPILILLLKLS